MSMMMMNEKTSLLKNKVGCLQFEVENLLSKSIFLQGAGAPAVIVKLLGLLVEVVVEIEKLNGVENGE